MKKHLILSFLFLFLFFACSSIKVERLDVKEKIDISGLWNDSDSRLVAENMIENVLKGRWLDNFVQKKKKKPVAIIGTIRNRSDEHINTRTFVKNLERFLVNSGELDFVASKDERLEIRDERVEQAKYSSEETAKNEGEEIGADVILKGSINTITDKIEGKMIKYYQVNLELINIESHKKLWIGEKQIKKIIKVKKFGI